MRSASMLQMKDRLDQNKLNKTPAHRHTGQSKVQSRIPKEQPKELKAFRPKSLKNKDPEVSS